MQEKLILGEKLTAYQRLQMKHDEVYHHEIFVLGISRRMNHVALHLIKYLAPLFSLPSSATENKKAFIDAFIMVVSASNLLGISLAKDITVTNTDSNASQVFVNTYIRLLAELSKACEATDHQEDYPVRSIWNRNIRELFILLVREADSRNISLLDEASRRLASVKSKHPLHNIFQGEA
jgi:hypothetical protein